MTLCLREAEYTQLIVAYDQIGAIMRQLYRMSTFIYCDNMITL